MLSRSELDKMVEALAFPGADSADRNLSPDARRRGGVFFTPPTLVEFTVDRVLTDYLARFPIPTLIRVLDPACGDGRFLAAAARWLSARGISYAVTGIERDPELAALASQVAVVHCGEALTGYQDLGADVVVGNPPYLRSIHLGRTDESLRSQLRGRYAATSFGEWDLYAAFIEQCMGWAGRGEVALVVPSRWFTAKFAGPLRGEISSRRALRRVVDFGALQVFSDATTYASVVWLSGEEQGRVEVARQRRGRWSVGWVDAADLSDGPWSLSVGGMGRAVAAMRAVGPALGEVAHISKGTGTNADRVFILEHVEVDGEMASGLSRHVGERVTVEAAALRECVRGRDVRVLSQVDGGVRCIYPYGDNGELFSPEVVQEWPLAWRYLLRCRERLDARERGRFRGDRFYQYGRPQNLLRMQRKTPKVIVPDVAKGGRAMVDRSGAVVIDSAYSVVPAGDCPLTPEGLAAVMSSPVIALWLIETGMVLRGEYVRMKSAYLKTFPLPTRSPETANLDVAAAAGAGQSSLSELVRVAYSFSESEWRELSRASARASDRS